MKTDPDIKAMRPTLEELQRIIDKTVGAARKFSGHIVRVKGDDTTFYELEELFVMNNTLTALLFPIAREPDGRWLRVPVPNDDLNGAVRVRATELSEVVWSLIVREAPTTAEKRSPISTPEEWQAMNDAAKKRQTDAATPPVAYIEEAASITAYHLDLFPSDRQTLNNAIARAIFIAAMQSAIFQPISLTVEAPPAGL